MSTARPIVLSRFNLGILTGSLCLGVLTPTAQAYVAGDDPETIDLNGVVRDFHEAHPDFNVVPLGGFGHYAANLWVNLGDRGQPVFTGGGKKVISQWYDKDAHPIQPYAGAGLPFGHFDVDVYDEPSNDEEYHEHEFDDKFDVTYIDVANDPKLLFGDIIGGGYPNNLNLEFINVHNGGGGTYTFEAGAGVQTGNTADGFTTSFAPASLTQLQVNFTSLAFLRPTKPNVSQGDVVDRDDAFAIRMYDVTTDALVYEIAVYHHYNAHGGHGGDEADAGVDSCDAPIADTAGAFADAGDTGAITSADSFDQWFHDELGTNLSKHHAIRLNRDAFGVWEYLNDDFRPIEGQLFGNEGDTHNNYFTYAIEAEFVYEACTDQFFEFRGNDDAWLFVNESLAIDLGGVTPGTEQFVAMDRLGLVDGEAYELHFFYASRQPLPAVFRMRTNIFLYCDGPSATVSAGYD